MAKEEKIQQVADLKEKLGQAKVAILTDFRGIDAEDMTGLRAKLRGEQIEFKVIKNTIIRRAVEGQEELYGYCVGPTAVALGYSDPIAPAKVLYEFSKENPHLKIKVGLLENRVLDEGQVIDLAKLPSREVLVAKLLGLLNSPITGFVVVLQGTIRNFLMTLQAIKEKKEKE